MKSMRVYMDVCCLNRPFDDQSQHKIHLETEAIKIIFDKIELQKWKIISSEVIDLEVSKIPELFRKRQVELLASVYQDKIRINDEIIEKAKTLQLLGIKAFDALHISCASYAKVDVFITTDEELIQKYESQKDKFQIRITNPLEWIYEVE